MIEFTRVEDRLPEFDATGWAHDLLFWDGDQLYSGSCRKRDGDPVFVDWWVGGCDSDAQWWAPWPKKPWEGVPADTVESVTKEFREKLGQLQVGDMLGITLYEYCKIVSKCVAEMKDRILLAWWAEYGFAPGKAMVVEEEMYSGGRRWYIDEAPKECAEKAQSDATLKLREIIERREATKKRLAEAIDGLEVLVRGL